MNKNQENWLVQELGKANFNDERLRKRFLLLMKRFFEHPRKSIKACSCGSSEMMGAYRLFNNKHVEVEEILKPHQVRCHERIGECEKVYFIQDTSELDYTYKKHLAGSGPLTPQRRRGFYLDLGLMLSEEGIALGLERYHLFARSDEGYGQSKNRAKRFQSIEHKESFRWLDGYRRSCFLAKKFSGQSVIYLADREADIYDIYEQWFDFKCRDIAHADWIIRKNHNRNCVVESGSSLTLSKVDELLSQSKVLGQMSLTVKAKTNRKMVKGNSVYVTRKARKLKLAVRSTQIRIKAPEDKSTSIPEVELWVVEAKEIEPPEGEEAIHWVLYSSLCAHSLSEAVAILNSYARRWEIETFFKVLKSGCKVEQLQLKSSESLKKAIACYLIVSWSITYLTKLGRSCPQLPCDVFFEQDQWQALWVMKYGRSGLSELEGRIPSLGEAILLVASYGGYLNRKGDGPPGSEAMWTGLNRLQDFTLAWQCFEAG